MSNLRAWPCLGLLVLAASWLAGCTHRFEEGHLLRPQPAPATDLAALSEQYPGYRFEESRLPVAGQASLYLLQLHRDDARATVLYFGGNGYRIGLHAGHSLRAYQDVPVNLVLVDHRGYGGSTGVPTIAALKDDALAAYDHLHAEAMRTGQPLLVHGQSLGSFLAGHVADARTLDALVLESSVTTAEDWTAAMRARAGFWTRLMVRRIEVDTPLRGAGNLDVARRLDEPVLVVVGADDLTTAPAFSQALYDAAPLAAADKRLLVVPERGHNNATHSEAFAGQMAWLLDRVTVPADDTGG